MDQLFGRSIWRRIIHTYLILPCQYDWVTAAGSAVQLHIVSFKPLFSVPPRIFSLLIARCGSPCKRCSSLWSIYLINAAGVNYPRSPIQCSAELHTARNLIEILQYPCQFGPMQKFNRQEFHLCTYVLSKILCVSFLSLWCTHLFSFLVFNFRQVAGLQLSLSACDMSGRSSTKPIVADTPHARSSKSLVVHNWFTASRLNLGVIPIGPAPQGLTLYPSVPRSIGKGSSSTSNLILTEAIFISCADFHCYWVATTIYRPDIMLCVLIHGTVIVLFSSEYLILSGFLVASPYMRLIQKMVCISTSVSVI